MYEMLLIYDDITDPEVLDDVMTVLSDIEWWVTLLDAQTQHSLIVKRLWHVCDTLMCFQDERPGDGSLPQESALWLARSTQAAGSCQGDQLTWGGRDKTYVHRYKKKC